MSASYLLIRGLDHVVLGVSWSGFDVPAPDTLRAGADAILTLTFPPQHLAEQTLDDNPPDWFGFYDHLGARLAGLSHVAFAVGEGIIVPLTADGILALCREATILPGAPPNPIAPQAFPGIDAGEPGPTAIELPWRLVFSPESRSGTGSVRASHPDAPPDPALAALWHSALGVSDIAGTTRAGLRDAGLALRAIDLELAQSPDPPFNPPLDRFRRPQLAGAAATKPAPVQRLELSSLGGTLTVNATWPSLGWQHAAFLGRDVRVRTISSCVLYPFGHQAEYVEVTERVYLPWSPSIMGLRKRRTLVITEPVKHQVEDPALARAFPFTEVEIMQRLVENLVPPVPFTVRRTTPDQATVAALLAQRIAECDGAALDALHALHGPEATFEDFAPASLEEVLEFDIHGPDGEELMPPFELVRWQELAAEVDFLESLDLTPQQVNVGFWPETAPGVKVQFPIRCATARGDVHFLLPLLVAFDDHYDEELVIPAFDTLTEPSVHIRLDQEWAQAGHGQVALDGAMLDVVGEGRPSDVMEVRSLNITGTPVPGAFAPRLGGTPGSAAEPWSLMAVLPATRQLLGTATVATLQYADRFLAAGTVEDIALRVPDGAPKVVVDFVGRSLGSGGLAAPQLSADAISRSRGLVQSAAITAAIPSPGDLIGEGASLLGFTLRDLIDTTERVEPMTLTSAVREGLPPEVRMEWKDIPLHSSGAFVSAGARLALTVVRGTPIGGTGPPDPFALDEGPTTTCTVSNFSIQLPPAGATLLTVGFREVIFTQRPNLPPTLAVNGLDTKFAGLLELVRELQEKVNLGPAVPGIDVSPAGLLARYSLPVPAVACGAFALRNILFESTIEVPFDGRAVSLTFAFATRSNPFNLSVLMFGGGGYLELEVDHSGLRRLEASLEFGASVAISFGIADAEVHAMGGVRYLMVGTEVKLSGFLRIGGSVDLLGLITVSVELMLMLTYDTSGNRMVGRATLVLEIDLTFWSDSVELDSGEWEFIGGGSSPEANAAPAVGAAIAGAAFAAPPPAFPRFDPGEPPTETWRRYREAFAGPTA